MRDYNSMLFLQEAQKMLLVATKLHSWQLDGQYNLKYTNHPDGQFFYDIFKISNCSNHVSKHFASATAPLIIADALGFTWIVAAEIQKGTPIEYDLLGPYFTVEASERYLMNLCRQLRISDELALQLQEQLKKLPSISVLTSVTYAVMLQYYAIGETISIDSVTYINTATSSNEDDSSWMTNKQHNSWEAEQNLFEAIKNGTLNIDDMSMTNSFSGATIGTLCPGDPLRQAKDEVIVLIILATRAAILGGVSPEGGYTISDYYFQRVEASDTVGKVQNCAYELLQTIMQRVHMCQNRSEQSSVINNCKDYIETHIYEKINLDHMAKELGYASYYLSKKFKKETSISINDYIKEEKIKHSKLLLGQSDLTINEISERLCFSSSSYFCSIFKQSTGLLPSEYQSMSQIERNKYEN